MFVQGIRVHHAANDERSSVSWLGCHRTQASKYSIYIHYLKKFFVCALCREDINYADIGHVS